MLEKSGNEDKIRAAGCWCDFIRTFNADSLKAAGMWQDGSLGRFPFGSNTFRYFDHEIFRVEKESDGLYSISVRASYARMKELNKNMPGTRCCNFYVYVRETPDGLKITAPLDIDGGMLNTRNASFGLIDYTYPEGYDISEEEMKENAVFVSDLARKFGLDSVGRIRYAVSGHYRTSMLIAGVLEITDGDKDGSTHTGAVCFYNNRIICTSDDTDRHELVHAVFFQMFPKAPLLLHEGLAVYFGDSGIDYDDMIRSISDSPEEYLKGIDSADDILGLLNTDPKIFYSIGTQIIKRAFEEQGCEGILRLMKMESLSELNGGGDMNGYLFSLFK